MFKILKKTKSTNTLKIFFWNNKLLTIKGVLKPKVFLVLFSLFFSSLALAEPTFIADIDISAMKEVATGITFKPDGTKMYITGIGADKILQYNLTTAFDITSAALEKSVNIDYSRE